MRLGNGTVGAARTVGVCVADPAAVAAFNQRAAAYSTEVASVRSRLAEARALLAENSAQELKLK